MHTIARTILTITDPNGGVLGPSLDSSGVVDWGVKNVIPLILLVIGVGVIANARKGRIGENAGIITNVLIGLAVIAGAAILYGFAGSLVDLTFGTA